MTKSPTKTLPIFINNISMNYLVMSSWHRGALSILSKNVLEFSKFYILSINSYSNSPSSNTEVELSVSLPLDGDFWDAAADARSVYLSFFCSLANLPLHSINSSSNGSSGKGWSVIKANTKINIQITTKIWRQIGTFLATSWGNGFIFLSEFASI